MTVASAQAVTVLFTTSNPTTGAAADAAVGPTGTLYVNGVANAAVVTVTNITTGVYKAAVTMPTLAVGDIVSLRIAATVGGVAGEGVVWQDSKDNIAQTGDAYAVVSNATYGNSALHDDIATSCGSTGAFSVTYTVTISGVAAQGVYVRMTSDLAGLINIDADTTNALGQVTLTHDLPSGTTVYLWRSKAGHAFTDPDIEVIP